jgi:hypothetical protein
MTERNERLQRRIYRRVQAKTQPFLARPKAHQETPLREHRGMVVTRANYSMLQSIGEGSASDGLEILCDAFRGGLNYLRDGRRKKK